MIWGHERFMIASPYQIDATRELIVRAAHYEKLLLVEDGDSVLLFKSLEPVIIYPPRCRVTFLNLQLFWIRQQRTLAPG